jgi:hypothetical protein
MNRKTMLTIVIQAGDARWHAAAGQRREVRVRVPHEREGERLRLHGIWQAVTEMVVGFLPRTAIQSARVLACFTVMNASTRTASRGP